MCLKHYLQRWKDKKRPTTRNIKNWAESGKYERFSIK